MGLTGVYNSPVDEETGIAIILRAFERGVTFFDTSDAYGPLTNEILLGKARRSGSSSSVSPILCLGDEGVNWALTPVPSASGPEAAAQRKGSAGHQVWDCEVRSHRTGRQRYS